MPIKSKADLRYYLEQDRIALRRSKTLRKDDIWRFEILLRKAEYWKNCCKAPLNKVGGWYARRLMRLGQKCGGFNIHPNCFGPGLSIAHFGPVVVNKTARIGKNCRIHEGVTIGATGGSDQAATIGDNCFLATGCKFIGDITLGDGIAVGANAVVTKSFPEGHITLGGVPAKKISEHDSRAFLADELFAEKKAVTKDEKVPEYD